MSRKDYELIASILRAMPDHAATLRHVKQTAINAFVAGLQKDNPKFNESVFRKACGEARI